MKNPACRAGFEGPVDQNIGAAARTNPDIAYQRLALPKRRNVQWSGVCPAVIHHAAGFDGDPLALRRLIAISPVRRQSTVRTRVPQFQTAPPATRPLSPTSARAIGDFIDGDV